MSLTRLSALLLCIAGLQIPHLVLAATCSLTKVTDLHVTVTPDDQILIDGSIKGQPAKFQIATGTYATLFDAAVFSHFDISTAGDQRRLAGAGGEVGAVSRTIPDIKFGSFAGDNLHWTIMESHFLPDGVYGVVGGDVLTSFDLDIDLPHNTIGLFKHNSCPSEPVYWSQTFSEADLVIRDNRPLIMIELNGTPVEAVLDTGSPRSSVTTTFTHRLGLEETSQGMIPAGTSSSLDRHPVNLYTYRFAELHVGDEVIKNPLLLVDKRIPLKADRDPRSDASIGVDFIKNHHIYLAPKDRKMYFTYNGGGIFSPPKDDPATAPTTK